MCRSRRRCCCWPEATDVIFIDRGATCGADCFVLFARRLRFRITTDTLKIQGGNKLFGQACKNSVITKKLNVIVFTVKNRKVGNIGNIIINHKKSFLLYLLMKANKFEM